jgi:hypothetical protein
MLFFVDVIDVCGDLHPLEPAVTIGRTSRAAADTAHGTVVVRPYGSTLVFTAFIKTRTACSNRAQSRVQEVWKVQVCQEGNELVHAMRHGKSTAGRTHNRAGFCAIPCFALGRVFTSIHTPHTQVALTLRYSMQERLSTPDDSENHGEVRRSLDV